MIAINCLTYMKSNQSDAGSYLWSSRYLEASVVGAELLCQHGVEGVKAFLLKAAVHQNVNYLPLLLVLQAHPAQRADGRF